MDAASASSGPDEALDVESEHLWRAEEEAAEEEIRMAEEAAAEELWMAEEAAAQEMAELEEFAQEAEHWLSEEQLHYMGDFFEEDALQMVSDAEDFEQAMEQEAFGEGDSDDDLSLFGDGLGQGEDLTDFNDWGWDPNGTAQMAAAGLEISCQAAWEVPRMPLGQAELWHFGPNGPPMNIMDICPVSQVLWIANQRQLFGFSMAGVEAQVSQPRITDVDVGLAGAVLTSCAPELSAQANRIRCGQLGGQSVVVAVDAQGGVLVVPSPSSPSRQPVLKLQNAKIGQSSSAGVSTWGIGLSPHGEPATSDGPLLVSANDHCVKAWWLTPPQNVDPSMMPSYPRRAERSWQTRQANMQPSLLHCFQDNLPSIDVAGGRAILGSLGGEVKVLNLARPSSGSSQAKEAPTPPSVEETSALEDLTSDSAGSSRPRRPPRFPPENEPASIIRSFAPESDGGMRRKAWNACWIPLRCVHVVETPPCQQPGDSLLDWTADGCLLPAEIIRSFVLPLLGAQDLLQRVQVLNSVHAEEARAQVLSGTRAEHMAMIFSETTVWLTDGCLSMRCKQSLPFNGAFAHAVYMPGLSTVVVSTKMDSVARMLWAVTVLRRKRSLRFELRVTPLEVERGLRSMPWPRNIIVGMAAAPRNRLFVLHSGSRLICYNLDLAKREPVAGTGADNDSLGP